MTTAASWLTRHTSGSWHEWLGYAALTIVVWRIVYGIWGPRPFRFQDFVVQPQRAFVYARQLRHRPPARRSDERAGSPTHNPLGGYMVVALIAAIVCVSATGWMYTTDRYWGVAWVGDTHATLSDLLLFGIALHVAGVVFTSWHQRVNLIAAMLRGQRRHGEVASKPLPGSE